MNSLQFLLKKKKNRCIQAANVWMAAKCILKKNQGIYYGAFLSLINAAVTIILFLTGNFPGLNARFFQGKNAWQQQGNLLSI